MNAPRDGIAAFFDFDRTTIDADGGVLFGRELIRIFRHRAHEEGRGTLGWVWRILRFYLMIGRIMLLSLVARLFYYLRIIRRSTLVNIAYGTLKGRDVAELRDLGRDFVRDVLARRVYPEAARLMREHKDQGHLVIIATTNMRLLVDHVKELLPVDDVIGVELLAKDGRATGKVNGPRYGAEKAVVIREYAHRSNISLPKSYAYTDHFSDHFILPVVGHPRVINPRWRMRRMARRRRWDVLAFAALPKEKRASD